MFPFRIFSGISYFEVAYFIRYLSMFIFTILTALVIPSLFIKKLNPTWAIVYSAETVLSNIKNIKVLLAIVFVKYIFDSVIFRLSLEFDYSNMYYWVTISIKNFIRFYFDIIVFLAGIQVIVDIDKTKKCNALSLPTHGKD